MLSPCPPVKSWLSRYISKYRVFEICIVTGLFVTRLVADDVWRFYKGSQPVRDINFEIQWVFWIPLDGMKIWKINHVDDDKGINTVKWFSWQKNFNESNKIFFFSSLDSLIFLTNI